MKYIFQIHIQEPEIFDTAKERMDTFIDIWFAPEYRQCVRELYDANGHTEAVQAMIDDPEMRADDDELLSVVFTEREDQPGHTPGPWHVAPSSNPKNGSAWRDIVSGATEFSPSYVGEAQEHDAPLIAAAPELLQSVLDLIAYAQDVAANPEQLACFKKGVVQRHIATALAAITKATAP